MSTAVLTVPSAFHFRLTKHLVRRRPVSEEAAFIFSSTLKNGICKFDFIDMYIVPESEFSYRSLYGIELTSDCRAKVIKRAHDLNASLIELHSHPHARTSEFSPSDRSGFAEFVPHVWWRLKGRPYAAMVFGANDFDSLYWESNSHKPDGVLKLQLEDKELTPTELSFRHWDSNYEF